MNEQVAQQSEEVAKPSAVAAPVLVSPIDEVNLKNVKISVGSSEPEKKKKSEAPPLPEPVRIVSSLVQSIHNRVEERAKLVAEGNRKRLQFQGETQADQKTEAEQIAAWEAELDAQITKLKEGFAARSRGRQWELDQMAAHIEKIDVGLANLRKQLDVELGKLDPARK